MVLAVTGARMCTNYSIECSTNPSAQLKQYSIK